MSTVSPHIPYFDPGKSPHLRHINPSSLDENELTCVFYRFGLKMKLFNRFRSKKRTPLPIEEEQPKITLGNGYHISAPLGPNYIKKLDRKTLSRIFGFVCPHALDTSYVISDQVDLGKGTCMLCNLRDLANCSRVCKSWQNPAMELLYVAVEDV